MKCRVEDKLLLLLEYTDEEISWLRKHMSWYYQDGSVKDIKPGDYAKVKPSSKFKKGCIGEVVSRTEQQIKVKFPDGKEATFPFYHIVRVAKETQIYKHDSGCLCTFWGIYRLLRKVAPFQVEVENEPPKDYNKFQISPDTLPGIQLHDHQVTAVQKCVNLKRGDCIIPTAGGKSYVILSVLKALEQFGILKRALILVPSVGLASQLVESASQVGMDRSFIGEVHQDKKEWNAKVVVAVINSVTEGLRRKNPDTIKLMSEANAILTDESHHLRSDSCLRILLGMPNLDYILGFSGSPFLVTKPFEEPGDTLIWGLTGGPIYVLTHHYLMEKGLISKPVIFMKGTSGSMSKSGRRYQIIYEECIVRNEERNKAIALYAGRAIRYGHKVLILVQRLEHARNLMELLKGTKTISVFGGKVGMYFDDLEQLIEFPLEFKNFRKQFEEGVWDIAIGSQVMDEGVDLPSVGVVIMAGGGNSRIKNLQRLGRGLRRKKTGKNVVYVIDFKDRTHVYLNAHSRKRLALYQEIGAEIVEDEIIFNRMIASRE